MYLVLYIYVFSEIFSAIGYADQTKSSLIADRMMMSGMSITDIIADKQEHAQCRLQFGLCHLF